MGQEPHTCDTLGLLGIIIQRYWIYIYIHTIYLNIVYIYNIYITVINMELCIIYI